MTLRPLPRDLVGPALDDLAAPLARQFPSFAAFLDWQAGLTAAIATGRISGLATPDLTAVLLYQEQDGLATILAALGEAGDAFLAEAFAWLQARLTALIWDEWVGPDWPTRLAHLGARGYELQTRVQELARAPHEAPPTDLAIEVWRPAHVEPVVELLIQANAGRPAGLFFTYPLAPTPETYRAALEEVLAGRKGTFMPEASHVAYIDGQLAGVGLMLRQSDHQALIFEMATLPAARGRGVGHQLVRAKQRALRALGFTHLAFITTADNAGVHRLYREEEIVERTSTRGGYWLRGT